MTSTGRKEKPKTSHGSSTSHSSRISTKQMQLIIDKLMCNTRRKSTTQNYLNIWRQFNKFVINLDDKPQNWEDRCTLFIGNKIDQGVQSATVKSYVTAIKKLLVEDGYDWDDQRVLLGSLTRACRLVNDKVCTRLPIQCSLLEMLLFELQRLYNDQPYLEVLYKALFALAYYGMMRVSEVCASTHVLKAKDIQVATNKDKLRLVLYSSKTHSRANRPQKIKITSNSSERSGFYAKRYFCPFLLVNNYFVTRVKHLSSLYDSEQFFVFSDGSPVSAEQARNVLKLCIRSLGLNEKFYGMHSFRIGRTTDLIKYHYSLEEVKHMGRWHSNTVYRYIKL